MADGSHSYNVVGDREDLSDVITNISPAETPLFSTFGKGKASGVKHEWTEDALDDAASNAAEEGADYSRAAVTARSRLYNYTQIFTKQPYVSKTEEAILKAGIKSEMAYQVAKKMKEIKRDVEYAILNNDTPTVHANGTAGLLGGLQAFISTEKSTPAALTEDALNDALQGAWENGGEPAKVFCSGANKRVISSFTGGNVKVVEGDQKTLYGAIDFYDSDFGRVQVIAHRMIASTDTYVLDPNLWKSCYLRPFSVSEPGATGDRIEKVIVGELTLEARAEKGNAWIYVS